MRGNGEREAKLGGGGKGARPEGRRDQERAMVTLTTRGFIVTSRMVGDKGGEALPEP